MQIGVIGLGRMGGNIVRRLARAGHGCVVYDADPGPGAVLAKEGAVAASSVPALVEALKAPRTVWVMLPAGKITEETIAQLAGLMKAGDVIIDGGNTNFHDDVRRAQALSAKGLHYVDAGTSGGIWGLTEGYCLMVGGEDDICKRLEPVFLTLAPKDGYLHVGGHGAGHYVKMVHNGIEYGMMQAYAEGFELMQASPYKPNLAKIAALWDHGSVVRSWLLQLAARALADDPDLSKITGYVEDSGEGRWTVQEAIERAVPLPVITASIFTRFRSRQANTFAERMLAALRNQFGGHAVKKA